MDSHILAQAAQFIRQSQHVVVLTGAGISTPSGIPDFRSQQQGQWNRFDPMAVASLSAYRRAPDRFYGWFKPLALQSWAAQPNPAHTALARLEQAGKIAAVLTQNIDGLHQRAGSSRVIELHGALATSHCPACRRKFPTQDFIDAYHSPEELPRCPACQTIVKPDVVLYEEMLPKDAWEDAAFHCASADLIWVIGSSLEVYPVAGLPEIALEAGARLMISNLSSTALDERAAICLPYDVAECLPALANLVL